MATYNSGQYVGDQIESLLSQTYSNWHLTIRDDCSTDKTVQILKSYEKRYPDRIKFIEGVTNIGACRNFACLMELAIADYIMFSDGDDVWLPNKIDITLKKMKGAESDFGKDIPLLIHTDLKVVDKGLQSICNSFWKYQNIDPEDWISLKQMLIRNNITGCTVMLNKRLRELALPIPHDAIMHDWWVALVATAFGKIYHVKEPTILYRQHGKNDIGAKKWDAQYIIRHINNISHIKDRINMKQCQAKDFLERYDGLLKENQIEVLRLFTSLKQMSFLKRKYYFFKYKFFDMGYVRNIGLFLEI